MNCKKGNTTLDANGSKLYPSFFITVVLKNMFSSAVLKATTSAALASAARYRFFQV